MHLEKNNGYDSTWQSDDIRGNIAIPKLDLSTTYNLVVSSDLVVKSNDLVVVSSDLVVKSNDLVVVSSDLVVDRSDLVVKIINKIINKNKSAYMPPFDRRAYMRSYMLRYRGRQRGGRPSRVRVASPSPPMMLPSYMMLP